MEQLINDLISSCEEGIDGRWDCSKEGFEAMILQLEKIRTLNNNGLAFLKHIEHALNQVVNTKVDSFHFEDTYEICSEINKFLKDE